MSVQNFAKYLPTVCRMSDCKWSGHFTDIEYHVRNSHPDNFLEIHPDSYFKLNFENIRRKSPFLLSTDHGIYWFAQKDNIQQKKGYFSRGIFAIGPSEPVKYHIKLGMFLTRIVQILGPFESQGERSEQYDFTMQTSYMKYLTSKMTSNVVIFFGEFDDEADEYNSNYRGPSKWVEKKITRKMKDPENFMCSACDEFVPGAPFLCKRKDHYLCEVCFEIVISSDCPKCIGIVVNAAFEKVNNFLPELEENKPPKKVLKTDQQISEYNSKPIQLGHRPRLL